MHIYVWILHSPFKVFKDFSITHLDYRRDDDTLVQNFAQYIFMVKFCV